MKHLFNTHILTNERKKELLRNFLSMILILILATLVAEFDHQFRRINVVSIYLLAIVIIARVTDGYIWGVIASLIAVLSVNFLFTYPYLSFDFTLNGYPITFLIMSVTALLVNITTSDLKRHAQIAMNKEKNAEELYILMRDLVSINTKEKVINITISRLQTYLKTNVKFEKSHPEENFKGIHGYWYFQPLSTSSEHYGMIAVDISNLDIEAKEFERFLELAVSRTVMMLEHLQLQEVQRQTLLESEKEKMRSNLLRAVSHDLRTPLTTMLGATSTLLDNDELLDKEAKTKLLISIRDDCEWLIHMVENLLSITRIREGETKLKTTLEPAEEIISAAVIKLKKRCPDTHFRVTIPNELLMVPMDATLIEQVIINLCENSVHHSGCPSPIDITLSREHNFAVFTIRDYGRGLHPDQLEHLFDGYASYSKDSRDTYKGMGIGLSICMTIVKAHKGTIQGYNNNNSEQGGASFVFSLPMEENSYE